ncbi:MAG: putative DNA-binding domain-containing protein [Planctomycetes bacterium]|nr:putative DNA-binding domain-containing protein [Planctomycetota bacterium]
MSRSRQGASLRQLQQWLAFVVQHPRTADVAIAAKSAAAAFAPAEVRTGAVVRPNDRMSPTDRLQVYNGAYLARLFDVMAIDFGGVRELIGEKAFHRVVAGYVHECPSRHPNLNQLGQRFPDWLARQRPVPGGAFAVELARLELAITRAFDAPAFTPLTTTDLQTIAPGQWAKTRLTVNPSVQLLAFRHPIDAWFQAWKDERPRPPRRRGASWLCVYRKDWRVWRVPLSAAAFAVLAALQAGHALEQALGLAEGADPVGTWFQNWAADGLFSALRKGR